MQEDKGDYYAEKYWEMCRKNVYKQDTITVYWDEDITIHVNTDEVEGKEHVNYFKVFNARTWGSATKVCRISFTEPVYVYKENRDRCSDWILNAEEKKRLVEALKSVHHTGLSVFDAARGWCNEMNRMGDPMPEDTPMPDYTQLPDA